MRQKSYNISVFTAYRTWNFRGLADTDFRMILFNYLGVSPKYSYFPFYIIVFNSEIPNFSIWVCLVLVHFVAFQCQIPIFPLVKVTQQVISCLFFKNSRLYGNILYLHYKMENLTKQHLSAKADLVHFKYRTMCHTNYNVAHSEYI